jgi:hypothetical protein
MNQTFDIHRFTLMLKLDLAEKGRNMLLLATMLIVAILLMLLPITMSKEWSGFREALHIIALFCVLLFGSTFYTSYAFTQYSSPSTGIAALLVPASKLEKFLSSLLINLVFIIPFLLFFIKLHHVTIDIANAKLPVGGMKYNFLPAEVFTYFNYCYFILHSVVFLGSIYFTKASYIKTAVFAFVTVLVVVFSNLGIANLFVGTTGKLVTFPMSGWKIWDSSNMYMIRDGHAKFFHIVHPANAMYAFQAFAALVTLCFWYISYLRLKEKEI